MYMNHRGFLSRMQFSLAGALLGLFLVGCGSDGADGMEDEAPAATEGGETAAETAAGDGMEETAAGALLNPNLASEEELAAVPGVGDAGAAAIVAARPHLQAADLHAALAGAVGEDAAIGAYDALWLPINLNDVTTDEILLIPGVGDRMAHEFEEYRPYTGMDEFHREIGKYVDEAEVERLAGYVYVPIDLNAATRDEIMAVPGMSERMAHEFEEYRPYTDLDQFRREIGKYVDENEVARLERYVALN